MSDRREIKAAAFVTDMRNGMTNEELMEKYRLSSNGLRSVFRKLVDANVLKSDEIFRRAQMLLDINDIRVVPVRHMTRHHVSGGLTVYVHEKGTERRKGILVDL